MHVTIAILQLLVISHELLREAFFASFPGLYSIVTTQLFIRI
jgi:hypothetical protein